MLGAVRRWPEALAYSHNADRAVVSAAVNESPERLAPPSWSLYQQHAALAQPVMRYDSAEGFRDDKEIMLAAVRQAPLSLHYASERLRDDREVPGFFFSRLGNFHALRNPEFH